MRRRGIPQAWNTMTSADQGFGRRRPAKPAPAPGPSAKAAWPKGPPFGKTLWIVLAIVGGALLLRAVNIAAMRGYGRALDQHWRENVGYPGLEDAHKRTSTGDPALEAAHNDCKSRTDFVKLGPNETRALEGFDGLYSGESALAKAAFYVACLTEHEPKRFCKAAHRTHLAAALNDYFKLMAKVREERTLTMSAPFALEKSALINPGGGQSAPGTPPSARVDPRVVEGLRALLTNGYVSRRDLGGSWGGLPGNLDAELRGAEPRQKGCG